MDDSLKKKLGPLAEFVVSLTGYGTALHVNDVMPEFKKAFEMGANNRDEQIRSWHELPIKDWKKNGTGPIGCDKCGGALYKVRAKHPYPPEKALEGRLICPTCAIEILEGIYDNLYPNNVAQTNTTESNASASEASTR